LLFIPAIVLDVDQGKRRRRLASQGGTTAQLSFGAGSVSLGGTF
jgi:hypothetical protein